MLTLSRKPGESIIITAGGERITVLFSRFHDGKARIRVNAPASVTINRSEIQRKLDEQEASA